MIFPRIHAIQINYQPVHLLRESTDQFTIIEIENLMILERPRAR